MGRGSGRVSDIRASPGPTGPAPWRLVAPPAGLPGTWLPIAAAVIGLTLVDGGGFQGSRAVVAVLALAILMIAALQVRGADRDERVLIGGASLFALVWTLAAVGWGSGLSGARGLALGAVSLPSTLVVARRLSAAQAAALAGWVVRGAAVVSTLALIGFTRRASGWALPAQGVFRSAGTLGYPNAFGLLLILMVPLVAVQLGRAQSERERRWCRAAVFLLAASLETTMSRGAVVALVVAVVALKPPDRRRALLIGVAGAVAALPLVGTAAADAPSIVLAAPAVIGLIAVVAAPRLERRVAIATAVATAVMLVGVGLSTGVGGVAGHRLAVSNLDARSPEWAASVDQLVSAPLLGAGPEQAMVVSDPRDGHEYWSRFAHNELLQVAGGAGLLGLALLGLFGLGLVRVLRRRSGAHAASCALAFGVGGFVDFSWHFPAIAMVAGLMLGLNPQESEHT